MDKETTTPVKNAVKLKSKAIAEGTDKVVLVQVLVCVFFILLVFLVWKLSPTTFDFIKNEYNRIMSVDMTAQELYDSARGISEDVFGTKEAEIPTENTSDIPEAEGGEDDESADSTVAVMATLGSNKKITVPLHGRVTSRYGYRINPISGKYGLHTGVDIAADEGTNIVAAYNGVIKDTGYGTKKGNFVLMEHIDGSETLYCHCSEVLVEEGTIIRAGETIALVGNTGWSTGPHLHFEIHRNGSTIDPLSVINEKDVYE